MVKVFSGIPAFLVLVICSIHYVHGRINMTEYFKMPVLYRLDDYDRCMKEQPDVLATYCVVQTVIKPAPDNIPWEYIQKYSRDRKATYRHDLIDRGICLNECEKLLAKLSEKELNELYQEKFSDTEMYIYDTSEILDTSSYREKYGKIINMCVNYELKTQYNLTGYSVIESCTANNKSTALDLWDISFLLLVFTLVFLCVASTMYDYRLKPKDSVDHFRIRKLENTNMMWLSFSIPRNWNTLTMVKTDTLSTEFRIIRGVRCMGALEIIVAHVIFLNHSYPTSNTETIEEFYRFYYTVVVDGVRRFLLVSAYMFAVQFMEINKIMAIKTNLKNFLFGFFSRYIRLTPTFVFMILFYATYLRRMGDGPMWDRYAIIESEFCRKNLWINLLYFNNYYKANELCLQQGWFLNVEVQLYIIGLIVFFMFIKTPKLLNAVLIVGIFMSYISTAIVTYVNKFDGITVFNLNSLRNLLSSDEYYHKNYIPTHGSIGIYFMGLLGGILHHKLMQQKINITKYWTFRVVHNVSFLLLFGELFVSMVFYRIEFEKPALWIAIYSTFVRHLWAWYPCIFIINFAQSEDSSIGRFLAHPRFNMLSKLMYSVYLCHLTFFKLYVKHIRTPIHFDWISSFSLFFLALIGAIGFAIILNIFVEIPCIALFENWKTNYLNRRKIAEKKSTD